MARLRSKYIALSLVIIFVFPGLASADSTISEFPVPTKLGSLFDIAASPDGSIWFTEESSDKIGRVTPTGVVTEFAVPTKKSQSRNIVVSRDDTAWFTELNGNKIGRITPKGKITEFAIPTAKSMPDDIIVGSDDNVWFAELHGNKIGRITPKGKITEFAVPTPNSVPDRLVIGPDGNMWFTEGYGNKIGRITPQGAITEFALPTADSGPSGLAVGKDGNLWFTEVDGNNIGRITPKGAITEFAVPTALSKPDVIVAAVDGNLWFTNINQSQIGRVTLSGTITEFRVEDVAYDMVATPDGNVWFTEYNFNKIGQVTPAGVVTEFEPPTRFSAAHITVGADGNVWFTEPFGDKIGRINLDVPVATSAAGADIEQANSTSNSSCIGVQPAAGDKTKPGNQKKWSGPAQVIDVSHIYCAIFTTNHGRMVAQLFPRIAPKNVNNFVFLAQNGFYDNITWHRVIADFVAQSGDPTGSGAGSPGYSNIPLEVVDGLKYDREGRIGVARTSDPDSAGSQFFITLAPLPHLDDQYTIIGQVVEGLSVLHQIKIRNADQTANLPKGDPLVSVRIVDLGPATPSK